MDDRTAHLPGGRPYTVELVRSHRNKPGGFWVASTVPEAAYHAVTGSVDIEPGFEVGLFTDGVTRLVEYYGYDWESLFALLRKLQPAGVIELVRSLERTHRLPYGKQHDDATAVHISLSTSSPSD